MIEYNSSTKYFVLSLLKIDNPLPLSKTTAFTQSNSVRAVLEIFSSVFSFLWDQSLLLLKSLCARNMASGFLQIDHKLKNDDGVTTCLHDFIVNFFGLFFWTLVKFSYWSKFHVNIITGSAIMKILLYKGLIRNVEIGNTAV